MQMFKTVHAKFSIVSRFVPHVVQIQDCYQKLIVFCVAILASPNMQRAKGRGPHTHTSHTGRKSSSRAGKTHVSAESDTNGRMLHRQTSHTGRTGSSCAARTHDAHVNDKLLLRARDKGRTLVAPDVVLDHDVLTGHGGEDPRSTARAESAATPTTLLKGRTQERHRNLSFSRATSCAGTTPQMSYLGATDFENDARVPLQERQLSCSQVTVHPAQEA